MNNDLISRSALLEELSKGAEKMLVYIAGVHDMANAVRKAIRELGGC